MKDKNLPPDIDTSSLEELTNQANEIIESLENEKDLDNLPVLKYAIVEQLKGTLLLTAY